MFDPGKETVLSGLGKQWVCGRLGLGVIEDFVSWVREQVGDPFAGLEKIIDKVPPEAALKLIAEAKQKQDDLESLDLTSPTLQKFQETVRGSTYLLWLMLRQHHPEITREQAFQIAVENGMEEARNAITAGAGKMPEGNE